MVASGEFYTQRPGMSSVRRRGYPAKSASMGRTAAGSRRRASSLGRRGRRRGGYAAALENPCCLIRMATRVPDTRTTRPITISCLSGTSFGRAGQLIASSIKPGATGRWSLSNRMPPLERSTVVPAPASLRRFRLKSFHSSVKAIEYRRSDLRSRRDFTALVLEGLMGHRRRWLRTLECSIVFWSDSNASTRRVPG